MVVVAHAVAALHALAVSSELLSAGIAVAVFVWPDLHSVHTQLLLFHST